MHLKHSFLEQFPQSITDRPFSSYTVWIIWRCSIMKQVEPRDAAQCIHLSSLNRLNGSMANQMTFESRAADLSWMQSLNSLTLLFTHNPSLLALTASPYFHLTPWSMRAGDIISLDYIPTKMTRLLSAYWQTDKL